MKFVLIILLCIAQVVGYAQTRNSSPPMFTVDEYQGCAPLNVTVDCPTCDDDPFVSYSIKKSSTDSPQGFSGTTATITYNNPGTFTMTLSRGFGGPGNEFTITITVLPNTAPAFDVYACINNEAQVKINDTNYDLYLLEYPTSSTTTTTISLPQGSPPQEITLPSNALAQINVTGNYIDAGNDQCLTHSKNIFAQAALPAVTIAQLDVISDTQIDLAFPLSVPQQNVKYRLKFGNANSSNANQALKDIYNQETESIINFISTDRNFYCFQMTPVDACTGAQQASSSNTICSIKFSEDDITTGDQVNNLQWLTDPPDDQFIINKSPDQPAQQSAALPQAYAHNPAVCGTTYTYQIVSQYLNGALSFSAKHTATAVETSPPDPIKNVTASLNADATSASLSWQPGTDATEYSVYRNNTLLTKTASASFVDVNYKVGNQYCYAIGYVDQCGLQSTANSISACPVELVQDENGALSWNEYEGWSDGVSTYTVEKRTASGDLIEVICDGPVLTCTDQTADEDNQQFFYIIKAIPNDNTLSTVAFSNVIEVIKDPEILWPKAFNPESHREENRNFKSVKSMFVSSFDIQIFNRWGEMVFSSDEIDKGWDGSYNGLPSMEGIYAFKATIIDNLGRRTTRNGSVLLIRKK